MGRNELNVVKLHELIDYPSGNSESIFSKLHIHVYHGDNLFSKFYFRAGRYDNMTSDINDDNQYLIKYYCLKMALEGKFNSPQQLNQILNQVTENKN
jgi:hypothetical protein